MSGGKFVKKSKNFQNKTSKKGKDNFGEDKSDDGVDWENFTKQPSEILKFSDLPLSNASLKALEEENFSKPSEIQKHAIMPALQGKDILASSKTGSGKTFAFVIPLLERLSKLKWSEVDGTGALIITPTRELAIQIYDVILKIGKYHKTLTMSLIIGGNNLQRERNSIGISNIIIGTPGRLLQHMDETREFNLYNLQMLILDEADKTLDAGFKKQVDAILVNLPHDKQTLMFSATQTKKVSDLARVNLKNQVVIAIGSDKIEESTPAQLKQVYVTLELHQKINFLWSFIKSHLYHKTIVFLSACSQVSFIHEIIRRLKPGVPVLAIHGNMKQTKRQESFNAFISHNRAVLFATDLASRGLDFPEVNWVLQLDCAENIETYIHRVGRTARFNDAGSSLVVLTPQETQNALLMFEKNQITVQKIEVNVERQKNITSNITKMCAANPELMDRAKKYFVSYLKFQMLSGHRKTFDIQNLDLESFAQSLGLNKAPRIRYAEKMSKNKKKDAKNGMEEL